MCIEDEFVYKSHKSINNSEKMCNEKPHAGDEKKIKIFSLRGREIKLRIFFFVWLETFDGAIKMVFLKEKNLYCYSLEREKTYVYALYTIWHKMN